MKTHDVRFSLLLTLALTGCVGGAESLTAPADALKVTLRLDPDGFHGVGFDNDWVLPPNQDVALRVETNAPLASFSIPDHAIEAIASASHPGEFLFRTLPCRRDGGCRFRAVTVIGAGEVVREGSLRIEPTSQVPHDETPPRRRLPSEQGGSP